MNHNILSVFLFLTCTLLFNHSLIAQRLVEQTLVIPGGLPDPSIIEVDGTYYATGTSGDAEGKFDDFSIKY